VPLATFRKFEVSEENLKLGETMRYDRFQKRQLVEEHNQQHISRGQQQALERKQREERNRQLQHSLSQRNQRTGKSIRNQEARWELERERRQAEYEQRMRERVDEAKALDARLDASEAAQDARERAEGTASRMAVAHALEKVRTRDLSVRRQLSARVRTETHQALQTSSTIPTAMASRLAEEKRQQALAWSSRRHEQEDQYLARARANKAAAEMTRANAKAGRAAVLSKRKQAASRERANDVLVAEEKARVLNSNRREVAAVYSRRYVSKTAASRWEGSPLHRLHVAALWGSSRTPRIGWSGGSGSGSSSPELAASPRASPQASPQASPEDRTVQRC